VVKSSKGVPRLSTCLLSRVAGCKRCPSSLPYAGVSCFCTLTRQAETHWIGNHTSGIFHMALAPRESRHYKISTPLLSSS